MTRTGIGRRGLGCVQHTGAWRLASDSVQSYTYDGTGQALTAGPQTYTYPPLQQLATASVAGATTTYRYDADNQRRLRVRADGTKEYFVAGPGLVPLAEYRKAPGVSRVLVREYIYAGDRLIASVGLEPKVPPAVTWTDQPLQAGVTPVKVVHLTELRDAVNAARAAYDLPAVGWTSAEVLPGVTVIQALHIAELRTALAVTPLAGVDARRFTGKERDAETGLDYFSARYYGAGIGRFTTVDPYNIISEAEDEADLIAYLSAPQRWNRYGYALNNPGKYKDPDGENPLLISTAIGAVTFGGWKAIQNVLNDRPVLEGVAEQTLAGAMVGAALGAAPATDRHPVRAVVMIDRVLRNPAQEKLYAEMALTGRS